MSSPAAPPPNMSSHPTGGPPQPIKRRGEPAQRPFQSLLGEEVAQDASKPACFDATGVFGRRAGEVSNGEAIIAAERGEAPVSMQNLTEVIAETPCATNDLKWTPFPAAPRAIVNAASAAQPISKNATSTIASSSKVASAGPPPLPLHELDREPSSSNRFATRNPPLARLRASAIHIAVHAIDSGFAVYARVGRMSATEQEKLRHAVRQMLAEHGLSAGRIIIDEGAERAGAQQWPR